MVKDVVVGEMKRYILNAIRKAVVATDWMPLLSVPIASLNLFIHLEQQK